MGENYGPDIEVWRGGSTSNYVYEEKSASPKIENGHGDALRTFLDVSCYIKAAGGGSTLVRVRVSPKEFGRVARAMFKASPQATKAAFLTAMEESKST